MHLLRRTDDRIDRTRLQTQRAADTKIFIDDRKRPGPFHAVIGIQRNDRLAEQAGQPDYTFLSAWWALVVICLARGNGLGVRPASGIAAFGALRLGQPVFDLVGEGFGRSCSHYSHINGLGRMARTGS